ncbi:hypothetical protein [Sphingomonas sp. AX6]|uniref:hypothetical protein n=1 Tax=Sphingomonas sp. AX6 TaxID=2653171 RepID=UPI0012F2F28B|nr:hypothetical protein [Sphingomonas sp. AX6]VXC65404.1 hypothetical protein SPHINGOAX6_30302 [Sphingomonas sp. AX6]
MKTTLTALTVIAFVVAIACLFLSRNGASKAPRLMAICAGLAIATGLVLGTFALVAEPTI